MSAGIRMTTEARKTSHSRRTARQTEPFHQTYREAVHDLSREAPAIADLAISFPALLFALATGYGTAAKRKRTVTMVKAGRSLKHCAENIGLPWWTRKLTAGALTQPIGTLPTGGSYDSRLAQFVPSSSVIAGPWLNRVSYATGACDDQFALWVARQYRFKAPEATNERFMLLTAWAWYSRQPETTGYSILRRPWTSAMGMRRAIEEMTTWQRRIAMMARLGLGITDSWIEEGNALGYDFVALRTIEDFINESEAMDNCLDQFADHLDDGVTRLFSIRKNGKPVADVEIGAHVEEPRMPSLLQLRGPRNRRASPEIWQATFAWLGQSQLRLLPADRSRLYSSARRRQACKQFWKPYLDALSGSSYENRFKELVLGRGRKRPGRSKREIRRNMTDTASSAGNTETT